MANQDWKVEDLIDDSSNLEKHSRNLLFKAKILLIAAAALPEAANAGCSSLTKGAIAYDVHSCSVVNPEEFDLKKESFRFIADLDGPGRQALLKTYRGLSLKGIVVRSRAVKDGLDTKKGVLQGDNVSIFVPPGTESCEAIQGKRLSGIIQEKCCDGNGDAPCLLGNGFTLSSIEVLGNSSTAVDGRPTIPGKSSRTHGKIYLEAEKFYAKKDYKNAAKLYKKSDEAGDIDVKGLFRWGYSLRELEDCSAAVVPLEKLYKSVQSGKSWADEDLDSRRGIFLLARCQAKLADASQAVFYLNGFLIEPKKYQAEIKQSLKHKDFGWIHTTKEYIEYRAEAQKAIGIK